MSEECPATLQAYQNPSSVVGADIFPTVLWASSTPRPDKHGKTPPTCLWASTVLWAPSFTIHGEYGKTSHMLLTITTVLWAPTIILYPMAWATRLSSMRTLSLTCKAIPFIYKRGCALSQQIDPSVHSYTITEPPGLDPEHTFKHLAHSGVPVTLGPSDQCPTGPLVPPSFSFSFVTTLQTSSTWAQE